MSNERLLHLAIGIGEWTCALAHIEAVGGEGLFVSPIIVSRIKRERELLCWTWADLQQSRPRPSRLLTEEEVSTIVAEARAYATTHLSEIAEITELTNRKEVI